MPDKRERIGELAVVFSKRTDLGPGKDDARLERLDDLIVMERPAILRDRLLLTRHACILLSHTGPASERIAAVIFLL